MRKIIALFIFIAIFTGCKKDKNISIDNKKVENVVQKKISTKKVEKNGIATVLPEDTLLLAKFSSLESVYRNFSINEKGVFGFSIKELSMIKEQIGFHPLALNHLEGIGIDSKREFGYGLLDFNIEKKSSSMLIFIPIKDGKKLISKWEEILKTAGMELKDVDTFKQFNIDEVSIYLKEVSGYMLVIFNPVEDALTQAKAMFQKKTLSNSKQYQEIGEKAGSGESFYLYANFSSFFDNNSKQLKNLFDEIYHGMSETVPSTIISMLNSYQGMGLSVDFEKTDFILSWVAFIDKNSKVNDLLKDVSFKKDRILSVVSEPLFILSFALNPIAYWELIKSMLGEYDLKDMNENFAKMKTDTGVDFIEDILKNIGGNFNMGVFDSSKINLKGFLINFVGDFTVKDSKKAEETIEKLLQKTENKTVEEIKGTKTFIIDLMVIKLYLGVKGEHVIYSIDRTLYEEMISGEKSKGFLSTWSSNKPKVELNSDLQQLYFNYNELIKMFNNSPEISADIWRSVMNLLSQFEYTLITAGKDGDIWYGDFILKTKFKEPFLLELKPLIFDIAKEDGYSEE
ncbi:hypothetical protein JXR93_11000 [bacterium]|nr:hypothetical protein [bacterium]